MTSSKVAYLSKYIATTENDTNNNDKRKHHRNKKSKKSRRHPQQAATQTDSLIEIDNDIDIAAALRSDKGKDDSTHNNKLVGNDDDDNDHDDDNENEPVVVMDLVHSSDIDAKEPHVPRGTWENEIQRSVDNDIDNAQAPKRRRRHDSDTTSNSPQDNESMVHTKRTMDDHQRRRRHDSSSDDDNEKYNNAKTIKKEEHHHDFSDDERHADRVASSAHILHPRRQRHDSSSDEDSRNKKPRPTTHHDLDQRLRQRARHDSSDSSHSSSVNNENKSHRPRTTERMSSGHRAGIQTSTDFTRREVKLRQKKHDETNEFVRQHGAGGADTIYRDRESGKRLNDSQLQQQQHDRKNQVVLSSEEQRILNTGRVQLEREEQMKQEFQKIQEAQFARHRDDSELDMILKSKIHADDPMAAYAMKQRKQQSSSVLPKDGGDTKRPPQQQQDQRPLYKGPPPKPNRYNIPPGYRWDARDRGNGFEDKLLAKKYNSDHQKEQAYRYSSADM